MLKCQRAPKRITPAHAGKILKRPENMIAHGLTNVNKEEKMNNVTLIGNLTRDPELRAYNGESCCKFSVAINGHKRADGTQEADFIPVTVWGKLADAVAKYCHKGARVGILGRLKSGSYEKEGRRVYTLDVIAWQVEFLSSSQVAQTPPPPEAPAFSAQNGFTVVDNDELPF